MENDPVQFPSVEFFTLFFFDGLPKFQYPL